MNELKPRDIIWSGVGVLVLGGLFVMHNTSVPPASAKVSEIRSFLHQSIESLGPEQSYLQLKRAYAKESGTTKHLITHLFGEELYILVGLEGVQACDESFGFGCFHGFFIKAVTTEGLAVVLPLDEVCRDTYPKGHLSCQHGIAHGILEYLGHDRLEEAFSVCRTIPDLKPIGGCLSGVFMEYNVPLAISDEGLFTAAPRPFNPETPYDPCPLLSKDIQPACFHELPQWWHETFGSDFSRPGALCNAIVEVEHKNACFSGLGSTVPLFSSFDVLAIQEACDQMPTEATVVICLQRAAWALRGYDDLEGARELCSDLTPKERMQCPSH